MFLKISNLNLLSRILLHSFETSHNICAKQYFSCLRCPLVCNSLNNTGNNLLNYERTPRLTAVRYYAKGKDKKKEKAKGPVQINEAQVSELVNVQTLRGHMEKSVEKLKEDFVKNLSVRSSAGSIESLVVNLDGTNHTLQELGQIVRKNPKTIVVNMAAFPQAIPAAVKAMQKSGMNLNPQQEGTTLYVPVPKVTKEHRENLSKSAKQFFVKCKSSIRDVQTKSIKTLKSKTGVSEDLLKDVEVQIVAISDGYINQAEEILTKKQHELLGE